MDLICFSHLRWDFVYQRPQHLMKRAANNYRVYYFEEPLLTDAPDGYYLKLSVEGIAVVTPQLQVSQDGQVTLRLEHILQSLLEEEQVTNYIFWYYTPMMRMISTAFSPALIVYDCMDELSAFKNAPPALQEAEQGLLHDAQLVFTGGMSLYNAKKARHPHVAYYPSSIDYDHFAAARHALPDPADQAQIPFPRLGFFGVIDERFDIALLQQSADMCPHIHYIIIGPVVKIDPASLPQRANIHWLGMKSYEELPRYISNWNVAIMPFALNESTKFISPTKTPEYLAAGVPVISTAIADVVSTYGDAGLAAIVSNAGELVMAAGNYLNITDHTARLAAVDAYLASTSWDSTWQGMQTQIEQSLEEQTRKNLTHV